MVSAFGGGADTALERENKQPLTATFGRKADARLVYSQDRADG